MDLKKIGAKYMKVLVWMAIVAIGFIVFQLYIAIDLHNSPVLCEGTFKDRTYPKETCPLGAYCYKEQGQNVGKCLPYMEFFDVRRSPKFMEFKEIWR